MSSALDALVFGYRTIRKAGVALSLRSEIDFVGDGVSVADNPTTKRTEVTISGGGDVGNGVRIISALPATITTADAGKKLIVGLNENGTIVIPDVLAVNQSLRVYNGGFSEGVLVTVEGDEDVTLAYPEGVPLVLPRLAYAELTAVAAGVYSVAVVGVPASVDVETTSTIYRSVSQIIDDTPTALLTIAPSTLFGANQSVLFEIDVSIRADGIDGGSPGIFPTYTAGKAYALVTTDADGAFTVQSAPDMAGLMTGGGSAASTLGLAVSSSNLVFTGTNDAARSGWSLKIKATTYQLAVVEGEES